MRGRRALALAAVFVLVTSLVVFRLQTAANSVPPSTTDLISKTSANLVPPSTANQQGPNPSDSPSQSADGVWTAFVSANNLDPISAQNPGGNPDVNDPKNARDQIYVRNRLTGVTKWVSNTADGRCTDGTVVTCDAFQPSISGDGRFVAFTARLNGFAPALENCGPNAPGCEVYVADLNSLSQPIAATLVSTTDGGKTGAAGDNWQPAISADATSVAFVSTASLDDPEITTLIGLPEVFVHVMATGVNVLISTDVHGNRADLTSCVSCPFVGASHPTISSNGRFVAFESDEPLVPETRNLFPTIEVYAYDRDLRDTQQFDQTARGLTATQLASMNSLFQLPLCLGEGSFVCQATNPSISGDGGKIAFTSQAFNLAGDPANTHNQVFVHDHIPNVNLISLNGIDSGTWAFRFDQPIGSFGITKLDPTRFEFILVTGATTVGAFAQVDRADDTQVDVQPADSFGVSIARVVVLPGAVDFPPASGTPPNVLPAVPNGLESISNGGQVSVPGLNLVSVSATPTGVRFTFDDPSNAPLNPIGSAPPLRLLAANGVETNATSESVNPLAGKQVSVDATFPAPSLIGAVAASAPTGAVSFGSGAGRVVNLDDELLAPVRPLNVVASVDSNNKEGAEDSFQPSISADGRTVAFASFANFDGKSNTSCLARGKQFTEDVYARDLILVPGTTNRISLSSSDVPGDCTSDSPSVSGKGRYISFRSLAHNLAPDTNDPAGNNPPVGDIFLRDRAPVLTITPSPHDFGVLPIGSPSAPVVFTVTNTGEGAAVLKPSSLTGANPSNFQIVNDGCGTSPAFVLFPGDAGCQITVTFTPFSPPAPGPRSADLNVNGDALPAALPVVDHLTGTAGPANLVLTPSPETFGSVLVGSSATAVLTLTNTGGAPATVTSLPISGTNGGDFSVVSTNCLIAPIPAGGTCSITVKFTPAAVGGRNANLVVGSNANPVNDPLSGTGIQPAITLSPVPDNFGFVPLTTSLTSTVTATNTGTAPASITGSGVSGLTSDFARIGDGCSGKVLAPGTSCQIVLRFSPSAPGDRTGLLTVIDNAPGSPHTDVLRGRGVKLQILPNVGAPSDVATVIGDGWQPSHLVNVTWDPGLGSQQVKTDATGHFSVLMLLFRHDTIGPRKVAANDGTTIIKQPFLAVPGSSGPPGWILRR